MMAGGGNRDMMDSPQMSQPREGVQYEQAKGKASIKETPKKRKSMFTQKMNAQRRHQRKKETGICM